MKHKHNWKHIIRANQKFDIYWCCVCGTVKKDNINWFKGEKQTSYYKLKK